MKKVKRKIYKTKDPTWNTHTYGGGTPEAYPFYIEWLKHYNPMEGRDQIIFLYKDKTNGKICKHRALR